jgi:ribonucleoside-diphosphate reductase alpha chain
MSGWMPIRCGLTLTKISYTPSGEPLKHNETIMTDKIDRYCGIEIDLSRDDLLEDYSVKMLTDFYAMDGETSPQQVFARACVAWSTFKGETDYDMAKRLYFHVSHKHFLFASPVLSNAPRKDEKARGMPISCFLGYVPDTVEGLIDHSSELRWLSVMGGGVGGHWGDVRSVSEIAPGPIPFMSTVDADMTAYKQGKTRKGSYAAYLDVTHPDILEFINLRIPTGDNNRKCLNLHNAVNITDDFMKAVEAGEDYELIDPKIGSTGEFLSARKVWQKLLETRFRTGEPYLNFIDTANAALPEQMKQAGLRINGSNLCNEIHLPTNADRTAVCCLSSLNLEYYDEWKDTNLVKDLVRMLDNVIEYFIENAPSALHKAARSAAAERSIGLGAMGFHYYLQRNNLSFGDKTAAKVNNEIFQTIKEQASQETRNLADIRGACSDVRGVRNAHLMAVAPNASSGIILSTSPSIEPASSNAYTHRTRSGSFLVQNPYLKDVLSNIDMDNQETWSKIIAAQGSVQELECLTDHQKDVFKTAKEIDQLDVVRLAGDRQKHICQGQSVNVFFEAGIDRGYVHKVHFEAWKQGLKGLYYLRTNSKANTENVGAKVERDALKDARETIVYGKEGCPFCVKAKDLLAAHQVDFEYIDLDELGKSAAEVTGRKVTTVPQIYIDGEYVGGYTDLESYFAMGTGTDDDECKACEG